MAEKRDYYEVLGVDKSADQKTIKRAFLKQARELHPDVNKADDAEAKFKELNEAYSVLSDEQKRANYDRYGSADGPSGFGGDYVDLGDIFGFDIFESFFGGGRSSAARVRTEGRDMAVSLTISLEEAARGVSKTVSYERLAPCDDCNGTGAADGGQLKECSHCHGRGVVTEVQQSIFGMIQNQTVCPECAGTGKVVEQPCETCMGQGRTPSRETLKVEIPRGIHAGQALSLKGKGEAGLRGAAAGDLRVRIDVAPHERFERQGDDLIMTLEVDALEAMYGCTKEIAGIMPNEKISVDVPRATQYGDQLRLAGKGMPRLRSEARGSLICLVKITTPKLDDEELKLLEQLMDEHKRKAKKGKK